MQQKLLKTATWADACHLEYSHKRTQKNTWCGKTHKRVFFLKYLLNQKPKLWRQEKVQLRNPCTKNVVPWFRPHTPLHGQQKQSNQLQLHGTKRKQLLLK